MLSHLQSFPSYVFQAGQTQFAVDKEIADAICSKITIIADGSIIAEGASKEIKTMAGLKDSSLEDVFLHYTGRNG
jgi:ABC-type Na+ transport system ATPase subunit NatA